MSEPDRRHVLVTGGAGFIGSHLVDRLLASGDRVTVIDSFDPFYEPRVKRLNIERHMHTPHYSLIEGDIREEHVLAEVARRTPFDVVVHLAALAGVRPSLERPAAYMDVNVLGTQRLLDALARGDRLPRFVFGSSSSVYGKRAGEAFRESDPVNRPLSPYAASKAAGELLCHAMHHTTGMQVVCLRFFTVFGPRQRPDLAIHKFCRLIDNNQTIEIFGDGSSKRDYTYVDDTVEGIAAAMAVPLPSGFEIINLGRSEPVLLIDMIRSLERALGKKARICHKPVQTGDMPYTLASIDKARQLLGYSPATSFEDGLVPFVSWYRQIRDALAAPA